MDGIAATRAILTDFPEIKIIAMTSFEDEELVQGVLAAGAISYLLKDGMVISYTTVKAHISSILSKLQVSSRAEASAYAIKHKLVSLIKITKFKTASDRRLEATLCQMQF